MSCTAYLSYDQKDTVTTDPVSVTSHSVEWQWKQGTELAVRAGTYVHYIIHVSSDTYNWTEGATVPFHVSGEQWQQGTVDGLNASTHYWFYVAVYRTYVNGSVYRSSATSRELVGFLHATTQAGT